MIGFFLLLLHLYKKRSFAQPNVNQVQKMINVCYVDLLWDEQSNREHIQVESYLIIYLVLKAQMVGNPFEATYKTLHISRFSRLPRKPFCVKSIYPSTEKNM